MWLYKPEKKNQAWTGFQSHDDFYDIGAVLYQLSHQALWKVVTLDPTL